MFDLGFGELLLIGIVALIVIGPKDLPDMFRTLGRFTAKLRAMSRDFTRAMDQAAKDTGVGDLAKDLKSATSARGMGLDAVKQAADKFEKWDPIKNAAKPTVAAPPAATPAVPPVAAAAAAPAMAEAAVPSTAGPATQALAEKQAARKAIAREAAEKLKATAEAPAPAAPVAAKAPGRRRKTAPKGDAA